MSQHMKSNSHLSNNSNSNFDADDIGRLMSDLSHQESNATDRSSESASILQPNGVGITLMSGLNHLQSSPLQQFVNPNINAPKLEMPPSKVQIPDITPHGDEKHNNDNHSTGSKTQKYRNKPPDVQLPNEDEKEIREHPITPNTYTELTELSSPLPALSPIPPQRTESPSMSLPLAKGFSPTDMAQLAAMSRFIPHFWDCLQSLTQNVNSIQQQFSKLNHSKAQQGIDHSARSSTVTSAQTRYRSQSHQHSQSISNSSVNSLRTQTTVASNSTYNNTFNSLAAHGVLYPNSNEAAIPQTYSRRSLRNSVPGAAKDEKASSRRNSRSARTRKKSANFLYPQPAQRKKAIVYNNYSQYPRRKSIGPGVVGNKSPQSKNGSVSPHAFAYSPKGIKQYQLTADSLELLHISQRQKKMTETVEENKSEDVHENGKKNQNRRQRNRSQTVFISEKKQRVIHKQKRRTISDVNNNKIEDADGVFSDEEDYLDDEVSLYSSAALDTVTSIASAALETSSQTPPQTNALSIIHSTSEHSQFGVVSPSNINTNKISTNIDQILFEEEVEGNDKETISNKFHRKKKINNRSRKPSSSATSTITNRSNSELSISSMVITDTYNDSRSVPHSPVDTETSTKNGHVTAATVTRGDRRKSAGNHLYPTPKKRTPTLMQSHSEHNIYAIKATATQRPNTPTKEDHDPTTPQNTPNKTAVDAATISNAINAYDINARSVYTIAEKAMNKRRNSLTPPQEDKEQDDVANRYQLQLQLDDELMESAAGDIVILNDEEMIINTDKVHEVQIYNGYRYHTETQNNVVQEAAHVLFTEQEHRNGEDSVSISMTSSRPPSTKTNKNVHFDMHSIKNEYEIHDIEENKVATDDAMSATPEVVNHHNLLPSQVKNARKRGKNNNRKRGHDKILKLKNHIAYHHLNGKNRRGNLRKLRLSQQNLRAHNGLNQLKNKLMDAKLEKQHVAKMTTEQLQEMLIYINRIQWLILDEKQKRECCKICTLTCTSFALLLPCNHQSVCYHCASNLRDCPICNQSVTQIVLPRRR